MIRFRPIPGNNTYQISLAKEIVDMDNNRVDLETDGKRVWIEIYGEKIFADLGWLSLIAHYEIYLPDPSLKKLLNISFIDNYHPIIRSRSGKIPIHERPFTIMHNNINYRIIPGLVKYAISKNGEVIEIETLETIRITNERIQYSHAKKTEYPDVYLYDPETTYYKYFKVHRLVALAWLRNNDFINKPIVNHKNGNKKDYRVENLEWCSFQHNSLHAVNNDLRSDNIPCKIRNYETGKVFAFKSLSQASCFMGLRNLLEIGNIPSHPGYLIANKYEIRIDKDDRPWFYEDKNKQIVGRYLITITDPDGKIDYMTDLKEFKDTFKLSNLPNLKEILRIFKLRYPFYKIEIRDFEDHDEIQGLNVVTNEIITAKTYDEMSRLSGVKVNSIKKRLIRGEEFLGYDGYCFRFKTDKPWSTEFKRFGKDYRTYILTREETGERIVLDSSRDVARFLKIIRASIPYAIINGKPIKGWKIESEDKYPFKDIVKN